MRPSDLAVIARIRADLRSGVARSAREAVGVSRQAVAAWEAGKSVPSAVHALAYAKALAAVTRQAA